MKKVIILAVIALFIASTAWAQVAVTNSAFDVFTTTGATSVEYRYSQGIFTSMVDDFIDVNHFGF
ncbi:MAG: hypothetical protein FWC97_12165, partial [Treponema sp.]|nr:hypothetical protein [Treponema sp.]